MLIRKIIIFRPRFDILSEAAYTIFAIDSLRAFYLHLRGYFSFHLESRTLIQADNFS